MAPPPRRQESTEFDVQALREFVESFALTLTNAGMQRMAARAFAALLASESGSLTARGLADTLQVSPAAVSGSVRYLENARMLRRGRTPGERTDHYMLGDDTWYEAMATKSDIFDDLVSSLDDAISALPDGSLAAERMAETRDFFRYFRDEIPLLVGRWRQTRPPG